MPVYPATATYRSGFYNNKVVNGANDRVYNAKDLRMPYSAIFSDGVKPNDDGVLGTDLQVQAVSGMQIRVAVGQGMFGGAFFVNSAVYPITLDTAGSSVRYDCVIVKADDSENVRLTTIYIKSLSRVPVASDLLRTDEVKEYCLAYVRVAALATSITQANITDCRLNQNLCGVITGVYNQIDGAAITAQWETAFNAWFDDVRDQFVSGATLVRTYYNTYYSETANQTRIPIGVSQFDRNLDVLIVMVEGRVITLGTNYTIYDNNYIDLVIGLPVVGSKVQFQVLKSVDGSQAETVVTEVAELRFDVDNINRKLTYHYYCNGETDNIFISNIIEVYQTAATDYGSMRLVIHGQFGATTAFAGLGTSGSPYTWLKLAQGTVSNRKVIVDFTDCSQITINCTAGTYNIILYGMDVNIVGANVVATGASYIYMFSTAANITPFVENCRFWMTATNGGYISRSGTYKNCRCSVTIAGGEAYCFNVANDGLLRLIGGEYYAYTGSTTANSQIIVIASAQTSAVAITYGINCPTVERSGYRQTHAINVTSNSAKCSFTDTITLLTLVATGQNLRGTIAISKAGMN